MPPAPAIPTMPGECRWAALTAQAQSALETVLREMQDYMNALRRGRRARRATTSRNVSTASMLC